MQSAGSRRQLKSSSTDKDKLRGWKLFLNELRCGERGTHVTAAYVDGFFPVSP